MSERLTDDQAVAYEAAKKFEKLSPQEREIIKNEGSEEDILEKYEREHMDQAARRILPEISKIFAVKPEFYDDGVPRISGFWNKPSDGRHLTNDSIKLP